MIDCMRTQTDFFSGVTNKRVKYVTNYVICDDFRILKRMRTKLPKNSLFLNLIFKKSAGY